MARLLFTLMIAGAAAFWNGAPRAQPHDASLFDALGGRPGLAALMQTFVERLASDERTKIFFERSDRPRLASQLTDQLCMLSGGPCVYRGPKMRGLHRNLEIRRGDFNALVEVLQDSMDEHGIAFRTQNALLALLAPMHREIVTRE
jgi:hemoglobin